MRFSYELDILNDVSLEEIDLLHANITNFSPVVVVESDYGERIKFDLWTLITTFEAEILVHIVEACADNSLHLDDDY